MRLHTLLLAVLSSVNVVTGFQSTTTTIGTRLTLRPTATTKTTTRRVGDLSPITRFEVSFVSCHDGSTVGSNLFATSSAPPPDSSSEETEEWTKGRIHNKAWFRSLALMLAIGLVGTATPIGQVSTKAAAFSHLIAYSTWFGTAVYTTFILGLTMFKNLPRQTFGKLQSKLFPKYFKLCSSMMLIQFFTLNSLPLEMTWRNRKVIWSLGCALSATLFNQLYLEPYSTKIMLERYDLENTEGGQDTERYKFLKSTFGKMHGISSLSNLIALCGGVAYGFILSSLLL